MRSDKQEGPDQVHCGKEVRFYSKSSRWDAIEGFKQRRDMIQLTSLTGHSGCLVGNRLWSTEARLMRGLLREPGPRNGGLFGWWLSGEEAEGMFGGWATRKCGGLSLYSLGSSPLHAWVITNAPHPSVLKWHLRGFRDYTHESLERQGYIFRNALWGDFIVVWTSQRALTHT